MPSAQCPVPSEALASTQPDSGSRSTRIVILGAGFGGIYTALGLARGARRRIRAGGLDVVVVSRENFFFFTPFLTEVVGGVIGLRHIAAPVRRLLVGTGIRFRQGSVESVDVEARVVRLEGGAALPYDHLVVALGSTTSFFGIESVEKNALTLKSLEDALRVRNHAIACFERAAALPAGDPERRRLLTFVIAGAGPTGVELATDLNDLVREGLLEEYPEIRAGEVTVAIAEARDAVLSGFDARLVALAIRRIQQKGIQLLLNHAIESYDGREVRFKGRAEALEAATLVWTAGIKPSPVVEGLPLEKERGRVKVDATLRVPGRPEITVLGDAATGVDANGVPFSPEGQVAMQQARTAARNLVNALEGRPAEPFAFFRYGRLVALGTRWAVTEVFGLKLYGFVAWFVWRTAYLVRLQGIGNKLRVMFDWTLDLFSHRD
ncbi:MAG TPA: NAD(P)/FAD-dependent oxidoreductase, partial [Planctomycetota bacterium]|nr:NAD(P)/FAD-dependent oxidoreductase [Planctomycetota bacterium]